MYYVVDFLHMHGVIEPSLLSLRFEKEKKNHALNLEDWFGGAAAGAALYFLGPGRVYVVMYTRFINKHTRYKPNLNGR